MNASNPSLQISQTTKEKVEALKAYIESNLPNSI